MLRLIWFRQPVTHTRWRWNLLFWCFCHVLLIDSKESKGGATLTIEWTYKNPGSLLQDGRRCDRFGDPDCDVYFTLCLRNAASSRLRRSADQCHLYQFTTMVYDNTDHVEFQGDAAVKVFIPQPVPNTYTFEMGIYDVDLFQRTQTIAEFVAQDFQLDTNGPTTEIHMSRKYSDYANYYLRLTVSMNLRCEENFYGKHCTKECKPVVAVYTCDSEGNRVCSKGYIGELCDREDSCVYEPCAEHATCKNREDGNGRICECNGREDPECYPGFDPCGSEPCQHGGLCHRAGAFNESFQCECIGPWTGHRCTERRLACAEALERLQNETTGTDTVEVCLNGGKCLEYPDELAYRCMCEEGWSGARCEEPETGKKTTSTMMMVLIILIGASLLILTVVLIAIFIWRYRMARKRAKLMEKHGGIVYFHSMPYSSGEMSCMLGTPGNFVNHVYGVQPDSQQIFVNSPSAVNKNKSATDVYDECDPLGLMANNNVYGTAYGANKLPSSPEGCGTTRSSVYSAGTGDEVAPPLPERPENLSSVISRQVSLTFGESDRNSGLIYSGDGSTIHLLSSPGERRLATVQRSISPISYIPSTFASDNPPSNA